MNSYLVPNYKPSLILEEGKKVELIDKNKNSYLDWTGGIAVNCLGHCHPQIVKTLQKQANKIWHVSNYFSNQPAIDLAKKFCELTFAEQVFFSNSGGEANEAALKLSRLYAYKNFGIKKNKIHSFYNAFHGRSLFTVSVGGSPKYCEGFGPLPQKIYHTKFNDFSALEKIIDKNSCAVILELVQGEGGIYPADKDFLKKIRKLCDHNQVCLIFDEVQTGIARTGSLFGYQEYNIIPDILTTAKALGAGFPISAMLTKKKFSKVFQPGTHGSTFGGNPLACAIAKKVLEIVSDEKFLKKIREKSCIFFDELDKLNKEYNIFCSIRGLGLMIGAELHSYYKIQDFLKACLQKKLLVLPAENNVLRILPALNISTKEIKIGFTRLKLAINYYLKNE